MIISPPFLPEVATDPKALDPLMDAVDKFATYYGVYPIAADRRWHCGLHLNPRDQAMPVRAIADGEVVAYRVCKKAISDGTKNPNGTDQLNSNLGFVLLKHTTETGENRTLTYFSLYMHLLDMEGTNQLPGRVPAAGSAPHVLPDWLRNDTEGAVSGEGKKVYRKDVLGYMGKCQGHFGVHFEIFMLPDDYKAYFGATQLDVAQPSTPAGTDYWGHTYYVIPKEQIFSPQPPGVDGENQLKGIEFTPLQGGQNDETLYVETYFHKGCKFTKVWQVAPDGKRVYLTDAPEVEPEYEYKMYDRANKLYPACPSDGYELLRFGRILSSPATLPPVERSPTSPHQPNPRSTWVAVTFEPGKQGYIDLSNHAIEKLSDADFPSFSHWRTISEGAGPFNSDGLCDIEQLKTMLGDANASPIALDESLDEWAAKNKKVSAYLNDPDRRHVREQLRGFVCEAPTEWDTSNVEARYKKLLEPGEYFEGKEAAYKKFTDFAKRFCFWGKTGLPDGKLWFFHPLQFIRHFRKCGWLSASEFDQLLPTEVLREAGRHKLYYESVFESKERTKISQDHRPHLNVALRKHCITTPVRMAAFFGNALQETTWLSTLHENNADAWYWPWDGRGFLQLTHPGNYISYWDYRARNSQIPQKVRDSLSNAHGKANKERSEAKKYLNDVANGVTPEMLLWRDQLAGKRGDPAPEDPISPADSAGFYWSKMQMGRYADQVKPLERRVAHPTRPPDKKNPNLPNPPRSKVYYHSMSFRDASAAVNLPAAVGDPKRYFNGYIARCIAHAQVLAVVGEPVFPDASGAHTLHFPEGRTPRREKPKKAKS